MLFNNGISVDNMAMKSRVKGILGVIVVVVIGAILAGALIPTAVNQFHDADTSNMTGTEEQIWELIPIFIILAVLMIFVGIMLYAFRDQ